MPKELLLRELASLKQFIEAIPGNEAAWNFFRGLLRQPAAAHASVLDAARSVHASAQPAQLDATKSNSAYPLAANLHILELQQQLTGEDVSAAYADVCRQLCEADPIRAQFWQHKQAALASAV